MAAARPWQVCLFVFVCACVSLYMHTLFFVCVSVCPRAERRSRMCVRILCVLIHSEWETAIIRSRIERVWMGFCNRFVCSVPFFSVPAERAREPLPSLSPRATGARSYVLYWYMYNSQIVGLVFDANLNCTTPTTPRQCLCCVRHKNKKNCWLHISHPEIEHYVLKFRSMFWQVDDGSNYAVICMFRLWDQRALDSGGNRRNKKRSESFPYDIMSGFVCSTWCQVIQSTETMKLAFVVCSTTNMSPCDRIIHVEPVIEKNHMYRQLSVVSQTTHTKEHRTGPFFSFGEAQIKPVNYAGTQGNVLHKRSTCWFT